MVSVGRLLRVQGWAIDRQSSTCPYMIDIHAGEEHRQPLDRFVLWLFNVVGGCP